MEILLSVLIGLACPGQDRPADSVQARLQAEAEREAWIEKSVDEWMRMFDTSDAATRRARVGMYIGTANSKMDHLRPVFVRALGDPDTGVRMAAAGFILMSNVYSEAETGRASDVLGQALADPKVRFQAIYSLHNDPSKAIGTLPACDCGAPLPVIVASEGHPPPLLTSSATLIPIGTILIPRSSRHRPRVGTSRSSAPRRS